MEAAAVAPAAVVAVDPAQWVELVFALAPWAVDIAAAREEVTVAAMAADTGEVGEATDMAAAMVMDAGIGAALDSDLDTATLGMAAITAIRTHTDIHTTAVIIPTPTRTRRIHTAIPIHSSTDRLRNSSTANNPTGRHRIHNKAIRLSNRTAIRLSNKTAIRRSNRTVIRRSSGTAIRHLRRPTGLSRIPRPTMLRRLRHRPTTINLTASGIISAIPILSRPNSIFSNS